MSGAKQDTIVLQDQGTESTAKAEGKLPEEQLAGSEDQVESVSSKDDSEGRLDDAMLMGDDDVLTAICNDSGIEIISRVTENIDEANDQDNIVTETDNLLEELIAIAKPEDQVEHIENTEVVSKAAGSDSEIKTGGLDSNQIGEQNLPRNEGTIPTDKQSVQPESVGDKEIDEIVAVQNERLQRSDSKETESPFVFPTPEAKTETSTPQDHLTPFVFPTPEAKTETSTPRDHLTPFVFPTPEAKTETSTPQDHLTKYRDPSTKRLNRSTKPLSKLPSKTRSQTQSTESLHRVMDPKQRGEPSSKSPRQLPSKTWSPNLSTESLQLTSRIPRSNVHLGRSVSMVTPRVSSPLPAKGDKTPARRPAQKIPPLIHAQRRPGGLLKRSVSVQVIKKKPTELAEGMTLVLAVPVTHSSQSVSRSSGDLRQQFVISPYQEEHVLAATCPISGITRHIKIIL